MCHGNSMTADRGSALYQEGGNFHMNDWIFTELEDKMLPLFYYYDLFQKGCRRSMKSWNQISNSSPALNKGYSALLHVV